MKSRAMKGSSERIDDLIGEDRDELLEEYRSSGEGRKRAAAIFLVAGGEVARGAGGAIATGLMASRGVWIATALLGLAGAGFIGVELLNGDQSLQDDVNLQKVEKRERIEQVSPDHALTPSAKGDSTTAVPVELIQGRRSSAQRVPEGEGIGVDSKEGLSAADEESQENLHREEGEREVRRREKISTTMTIEIQSQNDQ